MTILSHIGICNPNGEGAAHVIYRHGVGGWYREFLTEKRHRQTVSQDAGWYLTESDWMIPGTAKQEC